MREVKFEKDGKEETCYIRSIEGYDDGYYWDYVAKVIYNDEEYYIQNAGSSSGWVPHFRSVSIDGPRKLTGAQLIEIPTEKNEAYIDDEYNYIERVLKELMTTFFKEGCKKCYEESEGGGLDYEITIDGIRKDDTNGK